MNRTFHTRIALGQYFSLVMFGAFACYGLWEKLIILAVIFMLLVVLSIERLIHTTYTITSDGKLILYWGRFSKREEILLSNITSVERASSMKIGRFAMMRYVLVKYDNDKCKALLPLKEDEFIKRLQG